MTGDFQLLLFSTNAALIGAAVAAGVKGIIVDWERAGKHARQAGADTQINSDTLDDLRRVRASTTALVICRINGFSDATPREVEDATAAGADEILLPMVRSVREVEGVLDLVRGRCGVGIMIETVAATRIASDLARLPLSRVYVGLNDLAIDRRAPNIFTAVADGTVERMRSHFTCRFGFGGLTLPDCGAPIPCRLLIAETARLGCSFGFLRRSFLRDIQGRDMAVEVPRLLIALEQARTRDSDQVRRDRLALERAIATWPAGPSIGREAA